MRAAALAGALLLATAAGAAAQVSGRVVDAHSSAGVEGAAVWLIGNGAPRSTVSAADGRYAIRDVPPAEYTLLVSHPGYDAVRLRITVRGGTPLTVELPLEARPVPMPPLVVQTQRGSPAAASGETPDRALARGQSDRRMERMAPQSAGALGDLVLAEAAREPPPDAPGSRRPHVLYIWGSSAERGRVLLDGATVNAPLHLGGILPPLDRDLLARADLRTGGISPRYDGGTTYIMDFGTRPAPAAAMGSRGEIDLLAVRASLAAPLGHNAGLHIGARRVNHEVVQSVLDRPFGYAYADALGRLDARAGRLGHLSFTGLLTRETIRLPRDLSEDEAGWRNIATALSWRKSEEPDGLRATASFSRGDAELPLLSALDGHLRATLDRYSASVERNWTTGSATVLAGADIEHLRVARRSSASADPAVPGDSGFVACTPALPCATAAATRLALFGEATWQPARRVAARAGVRTAFDPSAARLSLLPRAALTLTNGAVTTAATVSAGRFSQIATIENVEGTLTTASFPAAAQSDALQTGVAHATQLELQVTHRATHATVAASVFLRHHERGPGRQPPLTAPGADVSIGYTAASSTFSLGYSLLGRRATASNRSADYQHLAAVSAGTTQGRFDISISTAYGHGLPLTSIVLDRPVVESIPTFTAGGESVASVDDRAYFRIDGLISARWTVNARGRDLDIMPYVKLVNGLSRREALFYYQDGGAPGEPQPVAALNALPVIGLRWTF